MKHILWVALLFITTKSIGQDIDKQKKDILQYLANNLATPKSFINANFKINEVEVSGSLIHLKFLVPEMALGMDVVNCYSFDLTKINFAAPTEGTLDLVLIEAKDNDTTIFKKETCKAIQKNQTEKVPLSPFYETYFMLPVANKQVIAQKINEYIALIKQD